MKRLLFVISLVAGVALASDAYDQTVTSTNPTSASSTVLDARQHYAIQCDAAARYRTGVLGSTTATTNDVLLEANRLFDVPLPYNHTAIAVLSVAGVANCRIYKVFPQTLPPIVKP